MEAPAIYSTKELDPQAVERLRGFRLRMASFIAFQPAAGIRQLKELISNESTNIPIALTSEQAVIFSEKEWKNEKPLFNPIYCMEGKTLSAVQRSPLFQGEVKSVAENASSLAEKIIAGNEKKVLFLCGNLRLDHLGKLLSGASIEVKEQVVYETVSTPVKMEGEPDAVLFFSPSGVRSFFSMNRLAPEVLCFALGQSTAEALRSATGHTVIVSKQPDQSSLVDEVLRHFVRPADKKIL